MSFVKIIPIEHLIIIISVSLIMGSLEHCTNHNNIPLVIYSQGFHTLLFCGHPPSPFLYHSHQDIAESVYIFGN